jgi:hypothetical protein
MPRAPVADDNGMSPITSKRQMYAALAAGGFGNTIPAYHSVADWHAAGGPRLPFWGVRTMTPGGPCRLNCPAAEVEATFAEYLPHRPNVSVMISSVGQVTWLGDVWDSPTGVVCSGVEAPTRVHDWRALMKSPRQWAGVSARALLRRHLNASSLADLWAVFDRWPSHVVELSAMDRCFGTVPGRNGIVWEVRGTY